MRAPEQAAHYENLRELVFHAGERFPQTHFYLSNDPDLPFITGQALLDACGQFGSWIARRGQCGCHVALLGPNSAAWITCFFAAVSSGCAAVPLYYGSPLEDQAYCLKRSDSTILLYDKSCEKDAIALRDRQPGLEIFEMLFEAEYEIERIKLCDEYEGDDEASMSDNNSSAFNYRNVDGTQTLSLHAMGRAIDINPLYNPYITADKVSPANSAPYVDRTKSFSHKIDHHDICYKVFASRGWLWGGDWKDSKDYQHFYKPKENLVKSAVHKLKELVADQ